MGGSMIAVMIALGLAAVLGYVFLARVFYNCLYYIGYGTRAQSRITGKYHQLSDAQFSAVFFPISLAVILVCLICKLPIKAADFATNPSNYKFRIRVERK